MWPLGMSGISRYQLKEVAKVLYEQWRGERPLKWGPVYWEEFKEIFLDTLFYLECIEKNIVKFMNFHQGGMSVQEYSLKFTQLYKYVPNMVSNLGARMNKFVMGVSRLMEK